MIQQLWMSRMACSSRSFVDADSLGLTTMCNVKITKIRHHERGRLSMINNTDGAGDLGYDKA